MKLKMLTIRLCSSYESNAGKYTAEVQWEGARGEVKVLLDNRISEALLAFIGPTITEFSHRAALDIENNLRMSVEESRQSPAIEESNGEPVVV